MRLRARAVAAVAVVAAAAVTATLAVGAFTGLPARGAPATELVRTAHASAVDAGSDTVWILVLGSDARPGERVDRSRADSIHLVGVNARTHSGVVLGFPRDSWVSIPGHGHAKLNAALVFGGPQLFARTFDQVTGFRPSYVFITGFAHFKAMVDMMGGLDITMKTAVRTGGANVGAGRQHLSGSQALWLARARHGVPGGDLGRSVHQGDIMVAMLAELRAKAAAHGGLGAVTTALNVLAAGTETDVSPIEAFRLFRLALSIDPAKVKSCIIPGSGGWVGNQSVIFLDRAELNRVAADVRSDATLNGPCPKMPDF